MFYFSHTLFVGPDLEPLMSFIRGGEALLSVRWSMGVEDFDIKISTLITATPKAIGGNIQPGTVPRFLRRLGSIEGFTCDRLQCRLDTDVVADFRQPAANRVTDLVMPDRGEAPLGTR